MALYTSQIALPPPHPHGEIYPKDSTNASTHSNTEDHLKAVTGDDYVNAWSNMDTEVALPTVWVAGLTVE